MVEYSAPLRDMSFLLKKVFKVDELWQSMPQLSETVDGDTAEAILEEAAKMTAGLLAPINRSGDEEGAQWHDGQVSTPTGFKEAYNTFAEGGWSGLCGDPNYGGMGMPKMLGVLFDEMMYASNSSFALYGALTTGASLALVTHGSEQLKETYLPPMYEGRWAGSMCLTEPHSGTDLGLIRTKAVPTDDGQYEITGTKIFITGGEHDLTENIVHLVLAKLPDAPAGAKGISLFLVPKVNVNEDGSLGEANHVSCGSIEHKMGIKASSTCVMNFDSAKGYLIGEPGKGLACMFTMMNYERLSIGIQGLGCADAAYQGAAAYAKDRLQGRAANPANRAGKGADSILVHGDVRRMLMTIRSTTEAGRAFAIYIGKQLDTVKFSQDADEVAKAQGLVALLTPVAKAFFTDRGLESTVLGQQVFGGHGYIREWGMEQLVRDVRIAQIYEGTNGIQAIDLIGRKVAMNKGQDVAIFAAEIREFIKAQQGNAALTSMLASLATALNEVESITDLVIANATDGDELNANAVDYLDAFGYLAYAYMWCLIGVEASQTPDDEFCQGKMAVAQFFFARILPQQTAHVAAVKAGASTVMAMEHDWF